MARLSDHDVRDAEHALRMEITLILARYARRLQEAGKAHIQQEIERAAREEEEVDGTAIGRAAAAEAARDYFGGLAGAAPQKAIEGTTHSDDEAL